ncbi:metallophosphoesterase family protein [Halovivax gelatinilyticus]|uniref:metallophosphoesterase family protein n=1 Tax=Halovivax gelatinilyticus TaxID=2961597 RepID=UPI0020CA49AF|nr:metallophosphoesterase family protein [Halovivax gelatinilyticus]
MQIALISDVHANRVALEAVFDDCPPVNAVVCAGDVVGYNPWPGECVDRLREGDVPTVMGNHDRAVVEERGFRGNEMADAGVEYASAELTDEQRAWLASLPERRRLFDGRVRVVHGHPDDPDRYTYPERFSPRLLDEEDVLVLGHTHVQHVERYAEGIVVNPGSVGQPRDGDPRAGYAILDLDALTVDLHRVEYDVRAVQEAIHEAELPERTASRLERGK